MKQIKALAGLIGCFFYITAIAQIPTDGLVAYYPFNGNANDESGNGNNGTANGASLIEDRYGVLNKAYSFNGNGDYLSINTISNVTGNNPRTVSAWIKLDDLAGGDNTIYKGGTDVWGYDFTFLVRVSNPETIQLYIRRAVSDVWSEAITITPNYWINVSVAYDGTNTYGIKFYCNGQLKQTFGGTQDIFNTQPTNPLIGDYVASGYHSYFKGAIDDICIYNRELSGAEISQLYHEYEICDNKDNDGDGWIDETCIPSLSISDKSITEGNSGTQNLSFKVTLNHEYSFPVTCTYKTIDNTATAGSDFKLKTGTLLFNPGEKSKNITVKIYGDILYELDETFTVQIGQQINASITRGNAVGTILNDDKDCDPKNADGFDYPFGDRGLGTDGSRYTINEGITPECNNLYPEGFELEPLREAVSSSGWSNANDVGNYLGTDRGYPKQCGLHPGEDWNFKENDKDKGLGVFATANGKIIEITTVKNHADASEGYRITIEHILPTGEKIWSLYLHITDSKNLNGLITKPFFADSVVKKGDLIARIAKWKNTHLHFEIRIFPPGTAVWEHGNGNGYYTDAVNTKRCDRMTIEQVTAAFANMSLDGIIDPSDFIEHNRVICNAGIQTPVLYPPYSCIVMPKKNISRDKIEKSTNKKLTVSPNPANVFLSISGLAINHIGYSIEMINMSGVVVKKWYNSDGKMLDIQAIPAGIYLIRIGDVGKLKFIKE